MVESAQMVRDPSDPERTIPVPLDWTGLHAADWALTCGLTLYRMDCFDRIAYPWFHTTARATEDTFFTARAMEAGLRLAIDCDLRAGHADKASGEVYRL